VCKLNLLLILNATLRIKETGNEWDRRKFVRNLLKTLPTKFIGTNFMVLVTSKLMITMMEIARDLRLVNTDSQWFYVISDTNYKKDNISMVSPLIEEGNNIAFIYNFTRTNDECVSGIKCHANELLKSFVLGLSRAIKEEYAIYQQISDEEWEIVRPSKRQRRSEILEFMLDDLSRTSKCSNCTTWQVSKMMRRYRNRKLLQSPR
jgi:glutamate receptor, ionotropic, invertebrate